MLRITGYSDKYTAFPGEEIKFYVNAEKNEIAIIKDSFIKFKLDKFTIL